MNYILFIACFTACFSFASEDYAEGKLSEDAQIELLLKATQNSYEQLKTLQENLRAFRRQEALCIQSPDNAEALYKLSKAALNLLGKIRETCLEPYFRPSFLEELNILSKAAEKHSIPPVIQ